MIKIVVRWMLLAAALLLVAHLYPGMTDKNAQPAARRNSDEGRQEPLAITGRR